ncbi:MAG TPA: hypothetical protein DCR60_01495 [Psychrobacter sp.]|nr:hypothetical protein [Psychrobacter sp.]|tara:strand:+ start:3190 stop:3462 length:273 start_codon:yes stop_codon:yes gene_type:complete
MSQSNDILEPRLVAVDTYTLCHVDDYIQDVSNDCESLAYALNTIETADPASKGVIVAVRSALLMHSEHASKMSANIMGNLILQDEVAING